MAGPNPTETPLPIATSYAFKPQTSKLLPGASGERAGGWNCTGNIDEQDYLGDVAVVATLYQNGCYGRGNYSHRDFLVEQGVLRSTANDAALVAYRISPPRKRATKFLGSMHHLFVRVADGQAYSLYAIRAGVLTKVAELPAAARSPGQFVKTPVNVSMLDAPTTYVVLPSSSSLDQLAPLGVGAFGAKTNSVWPFSIYRYRYEVGGKPFDLRSTPGSGPRSWTRGPGYFFPVATTGGRVAVVWQDQRTSEVKLTVVASDMRSSTSYVLGQAEGYHLGAATSDGAEKVFFLVVEAGNGAGSEVARKVKIAAFDTVSRKGVERVLDAGKKGLNITKFTGEAASMAYHDGKLGLILPRTMHRSGDGLNHQGAIGVVMSAATLEVVRNTGQTSGHSFGNYLTVNSAGEFLGIDLGDNYPRGINLHKFTDKRRRSAVVYTFKTLHGTTARSPAGKVYALFEGASSDKQKFYQWSNDNNTYTSLGGVVETSLGYTVVFAGEANQGRALDNARTGSLSDSRNVGLVLVRKDFEKVSKYGNVVRDDMVLSSGASETGGFYTFGGKWAEQRNSGVVWLTSYSDAKNENASRVKVAQLSDSQIVLLWEKWTETNYVSTYGAVIDPSGKVLAPAVELGAGLRLHLTDNVLVAGGDVYVFSGNGSRESIEVSRISLR